ncbi:unnamed protein product [Strongylus vulgaris]|uniref:Uncharacterized protein n=1 Tax=Strongylus vulgaris TaxID=40348 RepID=A0A3P7LCS2_STRVU|nr:unnamed protein product [Strongylus vulgaris]
MLVWNCGGDVREVQVHYSLPAKISAGPFVQRKHQPIWSVASLEDVLLREESIPEFLMSICRLPSHYMTSPSMLCFRDLFRWIAKTRHYLISELRSPTRCEHVACTSEDVVSALCELSESL